MIPKTYYTYILTNKYNKVLYIGVTNDLKRRIREHKGKHRSGFTYRYNVNKLVYYEIFDHPLTAIKREKSLKNLVRRKKEILINKRNPQWKDLCEEVI